HGRKVFAILLLQDLAIVPLLALVALLAPGGGEGRAPAWLALIKIVSALGVVILAGRYLLSPLFRILASSRAREVMTAAALLVVLAAASAMTFAGLSPALGALLAGVLLAESTYRHELEADIEPFRGLFMGLFFMSVGMTVDPGVIARDWLIVLGGVVFVIVIKTVSTYGLMRVMRNSHETSVLTALFLPQAGEFGFVLYSAALASGVMPQEMASRLVALVILSMALTPPLLTLAPRLLRRKAGREREETFEGAGGGVLLIGFGRFGQIVSQLLVLEGIDVTAIDIDVEMIEAAERFGFKVYYGDGTRLDVLRAAGAERAHIICVCVEKKETANHIVDVVRATFPLARLYVRSYDRIHTLELLERDVDFEVRETYESAIVFGRAALEGLELEPERVTELELEMRRRDRERLALQQQGTLEAGSEGVYTRLVPRPEPLTSPRRKGVVLHGPDASGTEAGPSPPSPRDGEREP
ncbi:MAG: cation:proton antiporter, partial [Myxococcaceae bacterium]|nr:cation:proton antiporter [Myxococcaceae bacterium]